MALSGLKIECLCLDDCGMGGPCVRPGRTHLDPPGQICDLLTRQFPLGRHSQNIILITDRLDQSALTRVFWNNRRATVAPLKKPGFSVQGQVGFMLLSGAVTSETVGGQHRPDLFFKEFQLFGRRFSGNRAGGQDQDQYAG